VKKWDRKGWLGCELRKESTRGKGGNERTDEVMKKMPTAEKPRPFDVEKSRPDHVYEGVAPFARRHPLTQDRLKLWAYHPRRVIFITMGG
jgi:hypothetical protein